MQASHMGLTREKCRAKGVEATPKEDTKMEEEMDKWGGQITRMS
jgi:hypothetical protein